MQAGGGEVKKLSEDWAIKLKQLKAPGRQLNKDIKDSKPDQHAFSVFFPLLLADVTDLRMDCDLYASEKRTGAGCDADDRCSLLMFV